MNKYLISLLLFLSIFLTGCQVDVTTTVLFNGDGSGYITLKTELDEELSQRVSGLEANPVTQFQERVAQINDGWRVDKEVATSPNAVSLAVSKEFKNIAELNSSFDSLRESTAALGVNVVPEISVQENDETFQVNSSLPLYVSDEFAKANHYANGADLVAQVGTQVSSTLEIKSKTPLLEGNQDSAPIAVPSKGSKEAENPEEQAYTITSHLGETKAMDLRYETYSGSSWIFWIVIGVFVFLLLYWLKGVMRRAKKLREYRQLRSMPR